MALSFLPPNPPRPRAIAIRAGILLLFSCLLLSPAAVLAQSPLPAPSSAKGLFEEKPFGPLPPPTPTPSVRPISLEEEKPIPPAFYIGGAVVAALAVAALLYGAARAWRSSNLFDRQYRFPEGAEAQLRFGAMRCGGHMATIAFGPGAEPPRSKAKDA
ncbi:MAG TPA: hypothetical protein VK474_12515 [Chthoniobacterales bacterium]|nr:hypothetical protein [Chthoniobacterales bacterium]